MLAARFTGEERLEIAEVPSPQCPAGGLLVRVAACAVCGTDLKILKKQDVKIEGGKQRLMELPRITGHEMSGTVEEVGAGASAFKAGDRVAVAPTVPCGRCDYCRRSFEEMCDHPSVIGFDADGGFAQFMAVSERAVTTGCVNEVPDSVALDSAALTEPLSCMINCFEITPVEAGGSVAVIGAGPMGCFASELAMSRGAEVRILVDVSQERLHLSRELLAKNNSSATAYVDASAADPVEEVMKYTHGRGADLIITACGAPRAQQQALAMVAKRGRVNFFGGLPRGSSEVLLDTNLLHYKECILAGTHGSSPAHNRRALALMAQGAIKIDNYVTGRFPLERIMDAIDAVRSGAVIKALVIPHDTRA